MRKIDKSEDKYVQRYKRMANTLLFFANSIAQQLAEWEQQDALGEELNNKDEKQ